jgi:hypothetical protein
MGWHIRDIETEGNEAMNDDYVIGHAINAYIDTLNKADIYTKYKEAMNIHSIGIEYNMDGCFVYETKLKACVEQRFALNRFEYHTAQAMMDDRCKYMNAAKRQRELAAAWLKYMNDPARNEKAGIEEEERVAIAESKAAQRHEANYR